VYAATRPGRPLRVYSLLYRDSLEGDRAAALLSRERRTFEDLIRQKGHMVLPDLAQARGAGAQSRPVPLPAVLSGSRPTQQGACAPP
jgi:hypothetical protein